MLEGKRCLVIGSGISGVGAVTLINRFNKDIIFYDSNGKLSPTDLQAKLPEGVEAKCMTGELDQATLESVDAAILSPGVPIDCQIVNTLRDMGKEILGEIELAYLAEQGKVIAITGTNGKTTTTTLMGEIMKRFIGEDKTFVVGNIGNPYTLEVLNTRPDTVTVAEISSFQLETTATFRPAASAVLNVTPDHLNRHYTMECYAGTKEKIAMKQDKSTVCVLNYEDRYCRTMGDRCNARPVFFSSKTVLDNGYYLQGEEIYKAVDGVSERLMNVKTDMNLVGVCNYENIMAAIALAEGMGVPMDMILSTIKTFKAVEHRIEFVATKNGVDYYNDSKGTNPDAAIQGIRAMCKPTILIGGGYDKSSEYDEWIREFGDKVKALVLIGQTKEKIAECARKHGFENVRLCDTYEECLNLCTELAEPGDAVLLSPACASWGMFTNYEERGRLFKEHVRRL